MITRYPCWGKFFFYKKRAAMWQPAWEDGFGYTMFEFPCWQNDSQPLGESGQIALIQDLLFKNLALSAQRCGIAQHKKT